MRASIDTGMGDAANINTNVSMRINMNEIMDAIMPVTGCNIMRTIIFSTIL